MWTWLFFFCVVLARAQATYWVARVVTNQTLLHTSPTTGWRARVHRWLSGETANRGLRLVQRWGAPAVTVSFLTVGAQTAVNAGAGVARMPFRRYLIAMVPGCAAWALVWTTIGLSAFYAALGREVTSWWGIVLLAAAAVAALAGIAVRRTTARTRQDTPAD
ncbi:VTT domain-containing protein [Nocardioides insulae]|uniref:VTT domain-containing protein n=1 Tax=Nocardioides insulae TaxID=394734 RepID=UPI00041A918E|nr:VTT domain-containing protein [Nocardioides insulae]